MNLAQLLVRAARAYLERPAFSHVTVRRHYGELADRVARC